MTKLSILRGLLFTLLVTTAVTAEAVADNVTYDFRDFLKQGQVIWVHNTSEPGTVTCRRDNVFKVDNQTVSFQRHFQNNSKSFNVSLKGELFNWEHWENRTATPYDSMMVSDTQDVYKTDEILEVLGARNECAVVKVIEVDLSNTEKPTVWRELRVVATALNKTLSQDCWNYFNGTVQNASRPSYSPSCERI